MSSVSLDTLGINAEQLQDIAGTEEFDALIEGLLAGKSPTEQDSIMEAIRAELADAVVEYDEMLEGAKEDEDRARDLDDDLGEQRAEEEQDELKDIIKFLEGEAEAAVTEAELEYRHMHYNTADDVSLSTSDFEDGETVFIESTANLMEVFEDTSADYEEGTDYNEDGKINYTDYEKFVQDQKTNMYDEYQDIFLALDPGFSVTNTEYSGNKVVFTVSNGEKTINYEINNISEGVHITFDSTDEHFMSESTYQAWPSELQKITYFGESLNSVYENLHQVGDEDKVGFVKGYKETVAGLESVVNEFVTTDKDVATEKVEKYVEMLFTYYNNTDSMTVEDIWTDIYADLGSLPQKQQSEILTALMFTIATSNDQETTSQLFSNQGTNIEDVLLQNKKLSPKEKMTVMFLESYIAPGYYGGGDAMWASPSKTPDGGFDGPAGTIFYYNEAGNIETMPDNKYAGYFADTQSTIKGMEMLLDSLKLVGWATDNGVINNTLDNLTGAKKVEDSGLVDVISGNTASAAASAILNINTDDVDGWNDGIDREPYRENLAAMLSLVQPGMTLEDLASQIITFLDSMDEDWVDDLASGFIYYLNQTAPDLVTSLMSVANFSTQIKGRIQNGQNEPERMQQALSIINSASQEAAGASKAAEYGMSAEEYEAAVKDALIELHGKEAIQNMENTADLTGFSYFDFDLNDLLDQIDEK